MFRRNNAYPEDNPRPPCEAYREVERVLPEGYLIADVPPVTGRKLMITGLHDRITSYWELEENIARYVFEQLRDLGAPVHCSSANYDNR